MNGKYLIALMLAFSIAVGLSVGFGVQAVAQQQITSSTALATSQSVVDATNELYAFAERLAAAVSAIAIFVSFIITKFHLQGKFADAIKQQADSLSETDKWVAELEAKAKAGISFGLGFSPEAQAWLDEHASDLQKIQDVIKAKTDELNKLKDTLAAQNQPTATGQPVTTG